MNLKVKTTYTRETELEIPLPAFYKECKYGTIKEFVAILSEETMVRVWISDERTFIENQSTENRDAEIAKFHNSFELATEEDFFAAFNKAYASLELMPVKKYYANGMINATI